MGVILGLDVGSSTTKVVAMDENRNILKMARVSASDQMTSLFGAIGKLLYQANVSMTDVKEIMMTGIGAAFVKGDLYGIHTKLVSEFDAMGEGGLFMAGKEEAIVLGLGTGTAIVHANGKANTYMGGSAVGGGTLTGLCSRMFGIRDCRMINEMSLKGDVTNVDWGIAELNNISAASAGGEGQQAYGSEIPAFATSSNLGKMLPSATNEDVIRGILNMIYQTGGTLAVFAGRQMNLTDVVCIGSMATFTLADLMLDQVGQIYGFKFIIPERAAYATAIGAALQYFK